MIKKIKHQWGKIVCFSWLFAFSCLTQASSPDFPKIFKGTTGCFLLFDINKNKRVLDYNPTFCKEKLPPNSTFKVPLSLMAFNENLINQKTVFKWDEQPKGPPELEWDQNQTPKTWLSRSVVWVSQELTPKIGMAKIKDYLKKFDYGNQDFSGGITTAWLSDSLKISAEEQLEFLKKMLAHKLPVSSDSIQQTKENMFLGTLAGDWKLYGKTGSGNSLDKKGRLKKGLQDGWFVGFLEKGKETYAFVVDFSDKTVAPGYKGAGARAKEMLESIISHEENFH